MQLCPFIMYTILGHEKGLQIWFWPRADVCVLPRKTGLVVGGCNSSRFSKQPNQTAHAQTNPHTHTHTHTLPTHFALT